MTSRTVLPFGGGSNRLAFVRRLLRFAGRPTFRRLPDCLPAPIFNNMHLKLGLLYHQMTQRTPNNFVSSSHVPV
jgi:hypothetical protein